MCKLPKMSCFIYEYMHLWHDFADKFGSVLIHVVSSIAKGQFITIQLNFRQ